MKVGFIGLGNMGAAVARNIQRAGFEVAVRDLDRGRAATLEQNGAQWAESPRRSRRAMRRGCHNGVWSGAVDGSFARRGRAALRRRNARQGLG